jgi:hypothetical protein
MALQAIRKISEVNRSAAAWQTVWKNLSFSHD